MEITLFRALTSANIDPDTAQRVVDEVEEHIDMAVGQANRAIEGKLDSLAAQIGALATKIDAIGSGGQAALASLRSEITTTKWVAIGATGLIGVAGTAVGIGKLFF